jgi:hypothetical protein
MRLALTLFLLAACGRTNEFKGSMGGGSAAGGGAATGGGSAAGGGGQADCNTVADDSPNYFPSCPGTASCPECDLGPGDGGALIDGTYRIAGDIIWGSACGIVVNDTSHGTVVISNGTFQLVSTGPNELGSNTPTVRFNGTYTADGGQLFITTSCGGYAQSQPGYTSANGVISLSSFPGLFGAPVFVKRP